MSRKPLTAHCCFYISLALALIGSILRTVAMFTAFDHEIGYFDPSAYTTLLSILSFAAVLFPTVLSLATPKGALPAVWPEPKHNAAAALPFILMGVGTAWQLWIVVSDGFQNRLLLLSGAIALFSTLYYFMAMAKSDSPAVPALGFCPILWGLLSTAETYTDQFTTMNSPIKLGLQFGFLGVALLTTAELRFRLNKAAPRAALCIHGIALFFCLTGSIPTLIALAAGVLTRPIHGAYALSLLGVGLYAVCRLIFYMVIPAPEAAVSDTDGAETADAVPLEVTPDHITDEGGTP